MKLTSISKFGTRFIFVLMESMYNFCFTPNRRKDVCCNNFPFSFPPHCEIKLYNNYFSSQLELVHILFKSELKNQQQVCQRKKKNLNVHLIFGEQLWKWIAFNFCGLISLVYWTWNWLILLIKGQPPQFPPMSNQAN